MEGFTRGRGALTAWCVRAAQVARPACFATNDNCVNKNKMLHIRLMK